MNRTISDLSAVCRNMPLREKLLFVPSYSVGQQLGQWLSRSGTPWINLRITTPIGFASEITFPEFASKGIRFMGSGERLSLIEELCRESGIIGDRACFAKAAEVPGLIRCLSDAIHELRMAGFTAAALSPDAFKVKSKGKELKDLMSAYETLMVKERLIDHAGVLSLAVKTFAKTDQPGDRLVLVLSDFPFSPLERTLVENAGGNGLIVVGHTTPIGAQVPQRFFVSAGQGSEKKYKIESDVDLLEWVLFPERAPSPVQDDTVSVFNALGESNEIREAFRRILKSETPLDDIEMVIPGADPYRMLIRDMARSIGIPVTLAMGVPASMTGPGAALILYLRWQADDHSEKWLRYMLTGGYVSIENSPGQTLSARVASALILEAQIGWGRQRYAQRLTTLEESYRIKAKELREEGEEEKASWSEETMRRITLLSTWLDKVIGTTVITLSADEPALRSEVYDGCLAFLDFCRVTGELDAAGKVALTGLLNSLKMGRDLADPIGAITESLIEAIASTPVGASTPKPGSIHVSYLHSGGWSGRPCTFVMGLDQARFPGTITQDPVVLDEERQRLGDGLVQTDQLLKERVYGAAKLLASLRGRVTVSYPCRDLMDDRELMPSSLVLNVYRLVSGDRSADYTTLGEVLKAPAGFFPAPGSVSLLNWEWWLARHKDNGYEPSCVLECYPHLSQGRIADEARTNDRFTEYDGFIISAKGTLDPAKAGVVFSASQLESLAACPFRFFLTRLLGVEPLEKIERDPYRWLDGAQRGQLLHEVFRLFMEEMKGRGQQPVYDRDLQRLEELALQQVEIFRQEMPPPTSFALERDVKGILDACRIFLRDEEERYRLVKPLFFELSFGMKIKDNAGAPAVIPVAGRKSLMLRGRVDRVDQCGRHEYEVWDYKTGSTWGFEETNYYRNGRQLQHFLYSIAVESLLRAGPDPKASVVRAGYYFPGKKGNGLRITRDERDRRKASEILQNLVSLLVDGVFPPAFDINSCTWCDYTCACRGGKTAVARCTTLLDGPDANLEPLRRLRSE
ncbi:MAG: nuclease [Deltaproteobacteria bacterium]|nr:nuclease [Deltaproteobacteria bacterium]